MGHGTFATCQVAPKKEGKGGQRKAREERGLPVLSLVYDQASELSRSVDLLSGCVDDRLDGIYRDVLPLITSGFE